MDILINIAHIQGNQNIYFCQVILFIPLLRSYVAGLMAEVL